MSIVNLNIENKLIVLMTLSLVYPSLLDGIVDENIWISFRT